METELKTLKDLHGGCGDFECDGISYNELKAEAVKWVKEDLQEMVINGNTAWLLNRWIKRLNIIEEDLK